MHLMREVCPGPSRKLKVLRVRISRQVLALADLAGQIYLNRSKFPVQLVKRTRLDAKCRFFRDLF